MSRIVALAVLLTATALLLSSCMDMGPFGPDDAKGRVENGGAAGVVKVLASFNTVSPPLAQGVLSADGNFQVTLPVESAVIPYLGAPGAGLQPPCPGVTVSSNQVRTAAIALPVYDTPASTTPRGTLVRSNLSPGTQPIFPLKFATFGFVDRDVTIRGRCVGGDTTVDFDISFKKGYNELVLTVQSPNRATYNRDTSGLKWFIGTSSAVAAQANLAPPAVPFNPFGVPPAP